MAFPLPRGITPPEIAFLAEMEMVTILPRQRLEGLELLGVSRRTDSFAAMRRQNCASPHMSRVRGDPCRGTARQGLGTITNQRAS
jgi:hypothetical protein